MQRVRFDDLSEADRGVIEGQLCRHMHIEPVFGEQGCRAFSQLMILKHTAGQPDSSYPLSARMATAWSQSAWARLAWKRPARTTID